MRDNAKVRQSATLHRQLIVIEMGTPATLRTKTHGLAHGRTARNNLAISKTGFIRCSKSQRSDASSRSRFIPSIDVDWRALMMTI